jgi:hypothetical protein
MYFGSTTRNHLGALLDHIKKASQQEGMHNLRASRGCTKQASLVQALLVASGIRQLM